MAKQTFGMIFESRGDEVPSVDQVNEIVEKNLAEMREEDGLTSDDWKLCELAAQSSATEIDRASLLTRAHELNPTRGTGLVEAAKAIDRHIVEATRKLVFDVYGPPEGVADDEPDEYELEYQLGMA